MGVKTKNSHLNSHDRNIIERKLYENKSFKEISDFLCKSSTTISREIYNNRTVQIIQNTKSICKQSDTSNKCQRFQHCKRKNICIEKCSMKHDIVCKNCYLCTQNCKDYIPVTCNKINKAPYVCNACTKKNVCSKDKYFYKAESANKKYIKRLSESRQVLALDYTSREKLASQIQPLIQKGQSIAVIMNEHPNWFTVSLPTVYGYIEDGLLPNITSIDLVEKVKRKHRTKRRKTMMESKKLSKSRKNRTYNDFLEYVRSNDNLKIWELDTVMGRRGDEISILTLLSRETRFMFCFILPKHTCEEVVQVFDFLEDNIGLKVFQSIFEVIITDNGVEFLNAEDIEQSYTDEFENRTKLFYCDPNNPNQKPMIERNHEFLRRIVPKGTSFDFLRQEDLNLIMNHINSYNRLSNEWSTPYSLFSNWLDKKDLESLHICEIPADKVVMKPSLISERKKTYQNESRKDKSPN